VTKNSGQPNCDTSALALNIRIKALEMVHRVDASHIGGALSVADILAVIYGKVLKCDPLNPEWDERDRLIFSKGHCCSSLYAALACTGFFPEEELETFGHNGSPMMTHLSHAVAGVEFSTGSLGHGLPIACGKALAAKRQGKDWRVFAVLSDGEMDEGSTWEAMLFAAQHQLDNLVLVIDYNKIQSLGRVEEIMDLEPLAEKFSAFRWSAHEVDGHHHAQLEKELSAVPFEKGKPSCLIAHTVKGKGVDFMENTLEWHYRSPNADLLASAIKQLRDNAHA